MPARLLITRSREQADKLLRALAAAGIESVCVPVTRTEFVRGDELPELSGFDWIAFTSANGVRGFARLLSASATSLSSHCHLACLGEATAEVARRELLREVDFIGSRAHGSAFALSLIDRLGSATNVKLLYPCAAVTSPEFEDLCRAAGIDVVKRAVYQTQPVSPDKLRAELAECEPYQAALFYAPSAVNAFVQTRGVHPDVEAVAIGPTTADALIDHGFARVWISLSPAITEVIATVADALAHYQPAPAITEYHD